MTNAAVSEGPALATVAGVVGAAEDLALTTEVETPDPDRREHYVRAFVSGIRSAAAERDHFGWTRAYAEHALALCDRLERLALPARWLVLELCCGGKNPLSLEDALTTVEAVLRPRETT